MTEREMEEMIAAHPEEFFPGRGLTLRGRQETLAGVGRFDLFFEDRYKTRVLMELKARNLKYEDATQVANYKDALVQRGEKRVLMWLVAPRIPKHVREFLDEIGIEYTEIHVAQFREVAKRHNIRWQAAVSPERTTDAGSSSGRDARLSRATLSQGVGELYEEWPELAKAVNEAGQKLQRKFEGWIPRRAIVEEVARRGRWKRSSVMPSDYCYNRRNKSPQSHRWNIFIWHPGGRYEYVGPNYRYTGQVIEEPRSRPR